jgi:hypothetical protein
LKHSLIFIEQKVYPVRRVPDLIHDAFDLPEE